MGVGASKLRKCVGGSSIYAYKRLGVPAMGPKGYVPVCVGVDEESSKRFMIHTKALKDADFCELLKKSAEEYGFQNDRILRILFEVRDFESWIVTKCKRKTIRRVKPTRTIVSKTKQDLMIRKRERRTHM